MLILTKSTWKFLSTVFILTELLLLLFFFIILFMLKKKWPLCLHYARSSNHSIQPKIGCRHNVSNPSIEAAVYGDLLIFYATGS